MKPAWDKLMEAFKDSDSAVVGDVDCTGVGKDFCKKHNVDSYPTIKYGDPSDLQEYTGGRDFDALKAFADIELAPFCGPAHVDLCDEATQKQLTLLMGMESKQLEAKLQKFDREWTAKINPLTAKFDREWTVHIERPEGTLLGADLTTASISSNAGKLMQWRHFQISKINEGALETFNALNAADAVQSGDRIANVNGATDIEDIKAEFKKNPLDLLMVRLATSEDKANAAKASGIDLIKSVMAFKFASGQAASGQAAKGEL